MQNKLSKLFAKRGIKDTSELTQEERAVYDNYAKVLSKDELTIEALRQFLNSQVAVIEGKWRDHGFDHKADLIPYHSCYKAILEALDAPRMERENLERYLTSLL